MESKVGPILIGLAYLGLVVFIIVFVDNRTKTFDEFSQYWGLFGTLVGVATGAMPAFFFKAQADKANDEAKKQGEKAQAYASVADPDKVTAMVQARPQLFN